MSLPVLYIKKETLAEGIRSDKLAQIALSCLAHPASFHYWDVEELYYEKTN